MDRAERLSHNFDITPEKGVPMANAPDIEETPDPTETLDAQADEPVLDDSPDAVEREADDEREQDVDANWKLHSVDFAEQVGITPDEFFHNVEISTPQGKKSISEIVDGYNRVNEKEAQWQNERQQLQDQVSQGARQAISQPRGHAVGNAGTSIREPAR